MNLSNKNTPKISSNKYWNFMAHHDGTDWWHSVLKKRNLVCKNEIKFGGLFVFGDMVYDCLVYV